jgi:hypothetical protein
MLRMGTLNQVPDTEGYLAAGTEAKMWIWNLDAWLARAKRMKNSVPLMTAGTRLRPNSSALRRAHPPSGAQVRGAERIPLPALREGPQPRPNGGHR